MTSLLESAARLRARVIVLASVLTVAWLATPALSATPARVATLLPYVADALERFPGEVELVAAVAADVGGQVAAGAVDLGSPHSPNLELLAAARPDLIVGDRRIHAALEEKLGRSGARVLLVEAASVEDTFGALLAVGEAAGVGPQMRELVDASRDRVAGLRLRSGTRTVLPLFGAPGSYLVITEATWLGDLLAELGFHSVVAGLAGRESTPGYVELSEEVLATLDPDLVLLVTHGSPAAVLDAFERESERGGPWRTLAARIKVLEPALFARNPGLEMAEAARTLIGLVPARPEVSKAR